jgi:hypothetical protein
MQRHRGGRRGGALLFAAVLTIAALGGTAVASGVFRPDPRDVVEVDAERLLADINLRRQVEVAIRAVDPKLDGKCHPKSEIMRLVKRRIATTGLRLEIRTYGTDWPCWYVEGVVWDDNAVMVGEVSGGRLGRPAEVQPGSG